MPTQNRTPRTAVDDLGRAIRREEQRRKRTARTLTGVALAAILGIALVAGGAALSARRSSTVSVAAASRVAASAPAPAALATAPVAATTVTASEAASVPTAALEPAAPKQTAAATKPSARKVAAAEKEPPAAVPSSPQRFNIAIGSVGYEPSSITAKTGSAITLTVGKGEGCAAGFNIPELDVNADNSSGPVTIKLGKLKRGSYTYTCGMGMVSGTLRVR